MHTPQVFSFLEVFAQNLDSLRKLSYVMLTVTTDTITITTITITMISAPAM